MVADWATVLVFPYGVEVVDRLAPASARVALRELTTMCPGYKTLAGPQSGSACLRVASGSRRGGGQPASANRTLIRACFLGMSSSLTAARWGSARETNVSTRTDVCLVPSLQS